MVEGESVVECCECESSQSKLPYKEIFQTQSQSLYCSPSSSVAIAFGRISLAGLNIIEVSE
jgi:hypothetical protein